MAGNEACPSWTKFGGYPEHETGISAIDMVKREQISHLIEAKRHFEKERKQKPKGKGKDQTKTRGYA